MNVERHPDSVFCAAIEIECPAERAAFLDDACGDDAQLRQRVDQLLEAHGRASRFLADETETVDQDSMSESTMIGPYKLRERLGAGGMGVVWAAEQVRPVQRSVALKIIKPGMDSEVVVARFEAERQALALIAAP
jgi:eukaryotic-like serine/threonine-protein kinase